jgi:divinyl chlorophyllide a 8-vinyl-reductase
MDNNQPTKRRRVLLLGATGTIGRATYQVLVERGHDVVSLVRPTAYPGLASPRTTDLLERGTVRFGDVTDPRDLAEQAFGGARFDAVISCMASRTGVPKDAWAIDYQAHKTVLDAAKKQGVPHMVLLSAICVQKPLLAFQHAKLAFEKALIESGLTYSIVRPTAYFKSLSGQVERVKRGKPFLVFGDGRLTACKPISDRDLGVYLADCLDDTRRHNRILPIGGPGAAITPIEQGEALFSLLGRPPRFSHVPVRLLDTIAWGLGAAGVVIPALATKAELAKIGRYYATESMLVLDPVTGRYDAAATPSTGTESLFDYYAQLIRGDGAAERGDHAVF